MLAARMCLQAVSIRRRHRGPRGLPGLYAGVYGVGRGAGALRLQRHVHARPLKNPFWTALLPDFRRLVQAATFRLRKLSRASWVVVRDSGPGFPIVDGRHAHPYRFAHERTGNCKESNHLFFQHGFRQD